MPINFSRARSGTRVVTVEGRPNDIKEVQVGSAYHNRKGYLVFTEYQGHNAAEYIIADAVTANSVVVCFNSLESVQKAIDKLRRIEERFQ